MTGDGGDPADPDGAAYRVRTKLCGVARAADLDAVVAAGADAVGIVSGVRVDSPREVSRGRAATLLDRLPPFVTGVLVTMPRDGPDAAARVDDSGADVVQVHGLSATDVRAVADAVTVPVVAAVDVDADVGAFARAADAVLLDSTDERGGGGTGETHDWDHSAAVVAAVDVPVILAGGLTPANVTEAIDRVRPFAVDVASGVERRGGVKDHDAVRSFIERATGTGGVEA